MVERLLRIILAFWLAAALVNLYISVQQSSIAAAVALGLILSFPALFLGAEFVLIAVAGRNAAMETSPGLKKLLRAWCTETRVAIAVFGWQMPFRSRVYPDRPIGGGESDRAVLLIHGYLCNRGVWNPLISRLQAQNIGYVAINLEPVVADVETYVLQIDRAARDLEQATNKPIVVVAHSIGGVAVRVWLDKCRADDRVHRIITVGSPHRGTRLARLGVSASMRQLRTGSSWLNTLSNRESVQRRRKFLCFYSDCDNVIFPARSATIDGAENRPLCGTAHVEMLYHEEVWKEICHHTLGPGAGSCDTERLDCDARLGPK